MSKFTPLKLSDFAFFLGFYFLVCVCFLSSLLNSFYFIFNFERSLEISLFCRILFVICLIFHLLFQEFGKNVVSLICSPLFVKHYDNLSRFISIKTNENPFGCLVIFHVWLCLSCLHLFMIVFIGIDLWFELLYQFFNLLKLSFFPLVFYYYILTNLPNCWFSVWDFLPGEKEIDKIKQFTQKMLLSYKDNYQKFPKTTKTISGITILSGGMVTWGSLTQREMNDAKNMVDFSSSRINTRAYAENPELKQVYHQLLDNELSSTRGWISIAYNDLKNMINGNPSLATEYRENLKRDLILQCETLGEIELEELKNTRLQEQLTRFSNQLSVQNSPAAGVLISPKNNQSVSPGIPSCLEYYFF